MMNILQKSKHITAARDLCIRLSNAAAFIAPLLLRIALALPFFRSGLTRWDGFLSLSEGQQFLFQEQFKIHILGSQYTLPYPDAMAYVVAVLEILLPMLLFLGLATRVAAAGLLAMTCVIPLVVPDGWANFHLYWASISTTLIAFGSGPLSVDKLIEAGIKDHNRFPAN